jgi:hypothetical protein
MKTNKDQELLICLLEHFFAADDVFTETDAFDQNKLRMSYGRLYRAWKQTRLLIDPEFHAIQTKYAEPLKSQMIHQWSVKQVFQVPLVQDKQICSSDQKMWLSDLMNLLKEN